MTRKTVLTVRDVAFTLALIYAVQGVVLAWSFAPMYRDMPPLAQAARLWDMAATWPRYYYALRATVASEPTLSQERERGDKSLLQPVTVHKETVA